LKNKFQYLTLIALSLTILLTITPIVSAKSRESYLTDFIFSNQIDDEGFGETEEDTAFSLEIIDYFDLYIVQGLFNTEIKVDVTSFQENIENQLADMFANQTVSIYKLYYLLKALDILDYTLKDSDPDLHNKIYTYLNQTEQNGGGFGVSNTSTSANIISTYYVYNIYSMINEIIVNKTIHKNWILLCNNTDGGYGGNSTLPSTLLTTYYAVFLIRELGVIGDLDNQITTLNYLKSFYVSDSADLANYGGYLPDTSADNALLSSTFYCIKTISFIDSSQLDNGTTSNWVVTRQNFQDGGFIDYIDSLGHDKSSIPASYYAFQILLSLDDIPLLNENVFMVEFNFLVLLITLISIGVIIGVLFLIWRKRRI